MADNLHVKISTYFNHFLNHAEVEYLKLTVSTGDVMFLHLFVCLQDRWVVQWVYDVTSCLATWSHFLLGDLSTRGMSTY